MAPPRQKKQGNPDAAAPTEPQQGHAVRDVAIGTGVAAGVAAHEVPAAVAGVTVAAGAVLTAKAAAKILKELVDAFDLFQRKRSGSAREYLTEVVHADHPDRTAAEIEQIVADEMKYEAEFRRKQRDRLLRDLPKVIALEGEQQRREAVERILQREKRYTLMRENAMINRATAKTDALAVKDDSPLGAYWHLSPYVRQHCVLCALMGEKFWPWAVLKKIQPPVHHQCGCVLHRLEDAISLGWMKRDQVPDEQDAIARAEKIAKAANILESAANEQEIEAYLEELAEAAIVSRGGRALELEDEEGLVPKIAALTLRTDEIRPSVRRALQAALPTWPQTPSEQRAAQIGRWIRLGGRETFIPQEREFSRRIGDSTYTSPVGSTNVYRDGEPYIETGDTGTGTVAMEVGAGALVDAKDALRKRTEQATGKAKNALAMMTPEIPPVVVGDLGAAAHDGLLGAGFTGSRTGSGPDEIVFEYVHPATGSQAIVTYGRTGAGNVTAVDWRVGFNDGLSEGGTPGELALMKPGEALDAYNQAIASGLPIAAWLRRRFFADARETVRKALADQNPLDPQAARTPEEVNLNAALNEELSLAVLGQYLVRYSLDWLLWAQDNPLDSEVVGRYRTARAGLATILSQAGLDPVRWQGRLETLKGMASRQRIKRLAAWLLEAADPSHTSDDAERYVRGVLAPETPEARAELLKDFVPLLAVPGKRLRVIVGYEMAGTKYFQSTRVGVAVGNGEEPGTIEGMQPTYVKGLPFTATCILANNARTLYGMVPRELRMIDESPSVLTATVNGVEIGPGDRVLYTTGVGGTDEVKSTVEQVVRGGENWAIVARIEREDTDSVAILVTEPRISTLKSLETLEKDTQNATVRGDTPGDSEATGAGAIVNAVNGFTYTGADGVNWTARLIGCDETAPGKYAVEAALGADDERAGSLDFDIADGVFINRLAIPEGDAKTVVWALISHLSTALGKRLVFSGSGVASYVLARSGLNGDTPALYAGMDERNVRNLARGNATKATVGEFFARLKGAEGTEPFMSPYEVAGAGRDQQWIVPADEERWPLSLAQGQPMWLGKLALLSTQWTPELAVGPNEMKVRDAGAQVRRAHEQWLEAKAQDPGLDFGWPTDDGDLYWADDDELWSQIERIQQQSPEEIAEAWKRISTAAEFSALVMSKDAAEELRLARDAGMLPFELDGVIGFAQESRYHDLALDEHLIESVGAAAKRGAPLEVRLALLFHDAGKPESAWRGPDGRLHYYSNVREGKKPHEITGARLARKALARLGYEHETVEHVAKLIEAHMFQDYREPKPVKARRFLARYGDMAHELIEHKRADLGGKRTKRSKGVSGEERRVGEFARLIKETIEQGHATKPEALAITDDELAAAGFQALSFEPIRHQLLSQVVGSPELNESAWLNREAQRLARKAGHAPIEEVEWAEMLHPRDRSGQWRFKALGDLARAIEDAIGIDIHNLDFGKMWAHAQEHEKEPVSRMKINSPCHLIEKIDFAVHRVLPMLVQDHHPDLAKALRRTSPRWGWRAQGGEPVLHEVPPAVREALEQEEPEIEAEIARLVESKLSYDKESELIKVSKETPDAKGVHKFKAAHWTHPNGHPRCKVCGQEQPISPECNREATAAEEKAFEEELDAEFSGSGVTKGLVESLWDPNLHPRNRTGRWIDKLFTAAQAGEHVGIRAHGRGGNPVSETLKSHSYGGRDTGHLGTGVYFVSSAERIPEMMPGEPFNENRNLVGVDLSGAKLFRPANEREGIALHDALAQVNWAAAGAGDWPTGGRMRTPDSVAIDLPSRRADGSHVTLEERADLARSAVKAAAEDIAAGKTDADSASTRVMKTLGYGGVDVRGYDLLDNSRVGSVIYRPDERDLPEKAYKVLGTDGDITDCELCGRTDLKGTVALEDTQTREVVHFGSDCAARASGWTVKEIKDKTSAADKAARDAANAEHQAKQEASYQSWESWLTEKSGKTEVGAAIKELGGFTAATERYRAEKTPTAGGAPSSSSLVPLSQVIYMAEGAMVRSGQTGRKWKTPEGRNDTPEIQAANRAMSEFASEAYLRSGGTMPTMWDGSATPEGTLPIRAVASEYLKVEYGEGAKASANLMTNSITVLHETDDLTILHEVAHLIARTEEGADGHTPKYAAIARDLYRRHISKAAADTYWGIVGLRIEAPLVGKGLTQKHLDAFIKKHGPYAYHETALQDVDAITKEGIRSGEDVEGIGLAGGQRPGVAYMWLPSHPEHRSDRDPLRIDLRKLDPARFANDEDAAEAIYPDFPIEKMRGREDLGDWIEKQGDFDSPERIVQGMEGGTVGYEGTIPAEAIERNPDWFAKPENQVAFDKAVASHARFVDEHARIKREYEELQRRLNAGEYAGRSGKWAWDADGSTYMLTGGDPPIWLANDTPPMEIDEEMQRQGVTSKWRREMAKHLGSEVGAAKPSETKYVRYTEVRVGDRVKLPGGEIHGSYAWKNRQQAERFDAPFRTVAEVRPNDESAMHVDIHTTDGGVYRKHKTTKALVAVEPVAAPEPGYAPTKYERITANFPTEGGGTKQRTLLARVQNETPDLITAIEVKKDGSEWHGKDETQQRVVMMNPTDIVKREAMRMSLKYGELEPGEATQPGHLTVWRDMKEGARVVNVDARTGKQLMAGTIVRIPKARGRGETEAVHHVGITVRWDNGHEGKVTQPGTLRPEPTPTVSAFSPIPIETGYAMTLGLKRKSKDVAASVARTKVYRFEGDQRRSVEGAIRQDVYGDGSEKFVRGFLVLPSEDGIYELDAAKVDTVNGKQQTRRSKSYFEVKGGEAREIEPDEWYGEVAPRLGISEAEWRGELHPRDRLGKWRDVLGGLSMQGVVGMKVRVPTPQEHEARGRGGDSYKKGAAIASVHPSLHGQAGTVVSYSSGKASVLWDDRSLHGQVPHDALAIEPDPRSIPNVPDERLRDYAIALRMWRSDFVYSTNMRAHLEGREMAPNFKNDAKLKAHAEILGEALDKADPLGEESWRIVPANAAPKVGEVLPIKIGAVAFDRQAAEDYRSTFVAGGEKPVLFRIPADAKGLVYPDGAEGIVSGDFEVASVEDGMDRRNRPLYVATLKRVGAAVEKGVVTKAARANVGITPFRPEHKAEGFYGSETYQRFEKRMHEVAGEHGVTIHSVERATGVWEGETEPSASVNVEDGEEGIRRWAATLGKEFDQDAVLLFGDKDSSAALYSLPVGELSDKVKAAMAKHGLQGGRLRDGKLEVIGSGHETADQVDALANDLNVDYDVTPGTFDMIERGDYDGIIKQDTKEGNTKEGRAGSAPGHEEAGAHRAAAGQSDSGDVPRPKGARGREASTGQVAAGPKPALQQATPEKPIWQIPKAEFVPNIDAELQKAMDANDNDRSMAILQGQRKKREQWDNQVRMALSRGDLTGGEAKKLGYTSSASEDWKPLPPKLYHVTTGASAVRRSGLKSRVEQGRAQGLGLGGGEDDTISLTTDLKVAKSIEAGLRGMRKLVRGELTIPDLVEQAKRGDGADHEFYSRLRGYYDRGGTGGGLDDMVAGVKTVECPGLKPWRSEEEMKAAVGKGATIEHATGTSGADDYRIWKAKVPMTEEEKRDKAISFYSAFMTFREEAGGEANPVFLFADTKGLADVPESDIQTLEFEPTEKGQGYHVSDAEAEWRTASGKAVQLVGKPPTQERSERSKGRTRAGEIGTLKGMLANPDLSLSREDRARYSLKLHELEGDKEKAAKLRATMREQGISPTASRAPGERAGPREPGQSAGVVGGPPSTSGGEEYRMEHEAPGGPDDETAVPLHDLTGGAVYPKDFYEHPEYYGSGSDAADRASFAAINAARGKPNAKVRIYRALPMGNAERIDDYESQKKYILKHGRPPEGADTRGKSDYYAWLNDEIARLNALPPEPSPSFNPGDWVTLSRAYAKEHLEGERGWQIVSKTVPAKELFTDGNSVNEWGWHPSSVPGSPSTVVTGEPIKGHYGRKSPVKEKAAGWKERVYALMGVGTVQQDRVSNDMRIARAQAGSAQDMDPATLKAWGYEGTPEEHLYERRNGAPGVAFEQQHMRILEAGAAIDAEVDRRCSKEVKEVKRCERVKQARDKAVEAADKAATAHRLQWMSDWLVKELGWPEDTAAPANLKKIDNRRMAKEKRVREKNRDASGKSLTPGKATLTLKENDVYHAKIEALIRDEEAQQIERLGIDDVLTSAETAGADSQLQSARAVLADARRDAFYKVAGQVRPFGGEVVVEVNDPHNYWVSTDGGRVKEGDHLVVVHDQVGDRYWFPGSRDDAKRGQVFGVKKDAETGRFYIITPKGDKLYVPFTSLLHVDPDKAPIGEGEPSPGTMKHKAERAATWLPHAWLNDSNLHPNKLVMRWTGDRGHYRHNDTSGGQASSELLISPSRQAKSMEEGEATIVHELVHRSEAVHDGLKGAEWTFMWARVHERKSGEPPESMVRLRDVTHNPSYEPDEVCYVDHFGVPYSGKIYSEGMSEYYEVLSMGIEALATGSENLSVIQGDEEYRHFVYGAMVLL